MSFKQYVLEKYLGQDSVYGDLARDIAIDDYFMDSFDTEEDIRLHLISENACDSCLEVFKELWQEYESYTNQLVKEIGE